MVSIDMEAFGSAAGAATLRRLMTVEYKTLIDDDCGDIYAMYDYIQFNHGVVVDDYAFSMDIFMYFYCIAGRISWGYSKCKANT